MKTVELDQATASLAEYAREAKTGPLILTERGNPVAALVPIDDTDLETLSLGTNPDFLDLIERSRRRMQVEGGISSDEMRRRLGLEKAGVASPAAHGADENVGDRPGNCSPR